MIGKNSYALMGVFFLASCDSNTNDAAPTNGSAVSINANGEQPIQNQAAQTAEAVAQLVEEQFDRRQASTLIREAQPQTQCGQSWEMNSWATDMSLSRSAVRWVEANILSDRTFTLPTNSTRGAPPEPNDEFWRYNMQATGTDSDGRFLQVTLGTFRGSTGPQISEGWNVSVSLCPHTIESVAILDTDVSPDRQFANVVYQVNYGWSRVGRKIHDSAPGGQRLSPLPPRRGTAVFRKLDALGWQLQSIR